MSKTSLVIFAYHFAFLPDHRDISCVRIWKIKLERDVAKTPLLNLVPKINYVTNNSNEKNHTINSEHAKIIKLHENKRHGDLILDLDRKILHQTPKFRPKFFHDD